MTTLRLNLRFTALVCAYVACTAIALVALPGAPFVLTLVELLAPTLIATMVYRRLRSYSHAGEIALFAAATLMSIGLIANVHYFTTFSGGTCDNPSLQNYDSFTLWNHCNAHYGVGDNFAVGKGLFGELNAALMHMFGHSIVVPMVTNMYFILSSLVLVSLTTMNLTGDKRTAGCALCATAAVCYYLTMGTLLLRDAWVIFGMALAGYGLTYKGRYNWLAVIVGAALVSAIRTNWVWSIAIGIMIMFFAQQSNRRSYLQASLLISAIFVLWLVPTLLTLSPTMRHAFNAEILNQYYHFDHQQQQPFYHIIGNYFDFPFYKKILYLPLTLIVQFLIPFPWNYMRDVIYGFSQVYAHVAYPWYAFAGAVIYFICKANRTSPRKLQLFTLWAAFCWAVPCVLFGGTVSRYGLPAITLLAPCVGDVLTHHLRQPSFKRFALCYALLLALVLPTCYIIQTTFTS